ncbi:MAG: SDR family oxidoreductase [Gemmatimonadetes bacterium]|nr:SDR family oxidoreductase [Gemmatimonadota bacterium]
MGPASNARGIASLLVGMALGAGGTVGHALLLYMGQGFLNAAGWMLSLSLLSLAAGLWAGTPAAARRPGRGRWTWAVVAWGVASVYATFWGMQTSFGRSPLGGALAVLLVLAHPAYTTGLVLGSLPHGRRTGIAPAALAGCAVGVFASAALLIPRFDAGTIQLSAAGLVAAAAALGSLRPVEAVGMQGKVVLVTGVGDRGQVGFVVARRFLEAGARLIITARSHTVDELAADLRAHGEVVAVAADLTVEGDVDRLVQTARDRFDRLDALINVAGGLTVTKPLAETTPEEFQRETARNAATVHVVSRAALPLLRESRGAIVNFAAPAGERAVANLGAYSAAKAAVVALTRALALEEKSNGVRVNAIAPGRVDTAQNRAGDATLTKWVTREQIAELALFLAGPASSGVSGETIHALGDALR